MQDTHISPPVNGLTSSDVAKKRSQYGWNEIAEKKTNPLLKFLSFFWGPIPWMIEIACVLSWILHRWPDLGIILALLLLNACVGFWEEYHAADAVASLKKTLALKCRVKRDGAWTILESRELVPGDLIRLRLGDIVPADARLLEGDDIEADQSMLTGESLPVTRKTGDTVYSGSVVRRGEIDASVTSTGMKTNFGHTVALATGRTGASHFQQEIVSIGNYLIMVAAALGVLLVIVSLFRGEPLLTTVQFALILTIAAIPAAMPAVLTTTMALGARLLAAKNAIVTRLDAIFELAGMDILCCDKTGTLTQNKLRVERIIAIGTRTEDEVLRCAGLASRREDNDPIDNAILDRAEKEERHAEDHVTHFTPFDPVTKRTEAAVAGPRGTIRVSKGSVPVILALCEGDDALKTTTEKVEEQLASEGFRSLGVAKTDANGRWQFLGIVAMSDPPRVDAAGVIREALDMGVSVKMITGDQLPIARETAKRLRLGGNIVDSMIFEQTSHYKTGQLEDAIEKADGFAKAFPDHKFYIVESLQKRGHVVGMTGDGVNDAPALHKADAGIAVAGALDAARSAAEIVLLSPGLSVITEAIKESRRIFRRMTSYALYRIAETIRVLLFITLSVLVFRFYPVTAIMIILLALLNDTAILSIAFDNADIGSTPQRWNMRSVLSLSTALGTAGVVASFLLFYLCERVFDLPQDMIQSIIYLKLSVAGHLMIFTTRTKKFFWSVPPSKYLVLATLSTQIIATLIAVYGLFMAPVGWIWAAAVWGYAFVWFLINGQVKRWAYAVVGSESLE